MRFEFATANRILFGEGALAEIGGIALALGSRALVVTGSTPDRAAPVLPRNSPGLFAPFLLFHHRSSYTIL